MCPVVLRKVADTKQRVPHIILLVESGMAIKIQKKKRGRGKLLGVLKVKVIFHFKLIGEYRNRLSPRDITKSMFCDIEAGTSPSKILFYRIK